MDGLTHFAAAAGHWQGTNVLQNPMTGTPEQSPTTATIAVLLGGKFVRMDYTWVFEGQNQAGSLLWGYETASATLTAQWIDSWHMGDKVMSCRGTIAAADCYTVQGAYRVPDGPDWGWRMTITMPTAAQLQLVMYNIAPTGEAYLAVEADYQRG